MALQRQLPEDELSQTTKDYGVLAQISYSNASRSDTSQSDAGRKLITPECGALHEHRCQAQTEFYA